MSDTIGIESIQRLDVKPGETLVVTLSDGVTQEAFERMADVLRQKLPADVKLLIVNEAVKFGVVSSEAAS